MLEHTSFGSNVDVESDVEFLLVVLWVPMLRYSNIVGFVVGFSGL